MKWLAPIEMKPEHAKILNYLKDYLEEHPDQRFGQALFSLDINQFKESSDPQNPTYIPRDIHNDQDSGIIERIEKRLDWFSLQKKVNNATSNLEGLEGMTVNERLFATGLLETFDRVRKENQEFAIFILKSLKVDKDSIEKILK